MYSYQIEEASDEKLTVWMANAVRTGSDALGHTKSQQNEIFAEYYRDELIKRGHDIPEIDFWKCRISGDDSYRDKLIDLGAFNGEGSF